MEILNYKNVYIAPMMILVNFDREMLYETMFNYYRTEGGEKYLDALSRQDNISLLFCNEQNEVVRRICVKNSIKNDVKEMIKIFKKANPWASEEFDRAKEKLYRQFPSPEDLWKALNKNSL